MELYQLFMLCDYEWDVVWWLGMVRESHFQASTARCCSDSILGYYAV
jgi:hypothetical protein